MTKLVKLTESMSFWSLISDSTSILKIFGRILSVNLSFLLRQQIAFSHVRRYLGMRTQSK